MVSNIQKHNRASYFRTTQDIHDKHHWNCVTVLALYVNRADNVLLIAQFLFRVHRHCISRTE